MRNDPIICTLLIASICSGACSRGSDIPEDKKSNVTPAALVGKDGLRKQVEGKINDMLVAQFQVDRRTIGPDTRLIEDLKADELDLVQMILRIEEGFEITIPDDVASKLNRVSEFYDYVEKRLRENLRKPKTAWSLIVHCDSTLFLKQICADTSFDRKCIYHGRQPEAHYRNPNLFSRLCVQDYESWCV